MSDYEDDDYEDCSIRDDLNDIIYNIAPDTSPLSVTICVGGYTVSQIGALGVGFPLNRDDGLTAIFFDGKQALVSQSELRRFIALLQTHVVTKPKRKPAKRKARRK